MGHNRCFSPHSSTQVGTRAKHRIYIDCSGMGGKARFLSSKWLDLKKKIKFKNSDNWYCYGCHLPVNPPTPCHRNTLSGKECQYADIMAHVAWVVRNFDEFWAPASLHFQLQADIPLEGYTKWLAAENGNGSFHNELELFLWFAKTFHPDDLM